MHYLVQLHQILTYSFKAMGNFPIQTYENSSYDQRSRVKCHQNQITSRGNHKTYSIQVTWISDQ